MDDGVSERGGRVVDQAHDRISGDGNSHIADINQSDEEEDQEIHIGQKMLSAVSGSVLTSLLVTPLDVVRVRLQSQGLSPSSSFSDVLPNRNFPFPQAFEKLPPNLGITACCKEVFWVNNNAPYCMVDLHVAPIGQSGGEAAAECAVEETQRKQITSTLDGFRKIYRNEGITTLWRGLSPTLAMAVPANVVYFAGYDWLRTSRVSPLYGRVSDTYAPLIAGSSARVLAAICVSPIELFRTRMQAAHSSTASSNFKDTLSGVRDMVETQGIRSLWRGLNLTLWRDVPFSALYWWGYEATRNQLTDRRDRSRGIVADPNASMTRKRSKSRSRQSHTSTLVDSFTAGTISGGIAAVVTTPFDVGKTRQQVLRHAGDSQRSAAPEEVARALRPEDRSMPRFLWHIFKEEGMSGLFKGWAARTLKVAPACAIMVSSYELGKKMAQKQKTDEEQ